MRVTRVVWAVRHTLGQVPLSPLVKVRGTPKAAEEDFAFWPDFYSPDESRALLGLALWKLDRVDSTRRRRRRKVKDQAKPQGVMAELHDVFDGPYGFEEVSEC